LVADVERPPKDWRPIAASGAVGSPDCVLFIDGVRRTDAHVTVLSTSSSAYDPGDLGVCASYAAGVVRCTPAAATVVSLETRRGLFTTASRADTIQTQAGAYPVCLSSPDPDQSPAQLLSQSIQRQLGQLEIIVAGAARNHDSDPELLVVDGPLRGRDHLPMTLGFIKSHRTHYLPPELNAVVGHLGSGERTPVFRIGTSWERHTWYLRLPCRPGAPWTGVVRVECSALLPTDEVVRMADLSQVILPNYASEEHKDSRAPQNLYPIAGLENQLRRRLGDRELLVRALRSAAAKA